MRLRRLLMLELVVAALTLTVAGAFAHASAHGPASLFDAVERRADAIGRSMFHDDCITCHRGGEAQRE